MGNNVERLDPLTRLAIAQGVYKAVASAIKTQTADNVRACADDELKGLYAAFGASKVDLKIGGVTVGTLAGVINKGPHITDGAAFDRWARDAGYSTTARVVNWDAVDDGTLESVLDLVADCCPGAVETVASLAPEWGEDLARVGDGYVDANGELVPGVEYREEMTATRVTGCKPADVAAAIAADGALQDNIGIIGVLGA